MSSTSLPQEGFRFQLRRRLNLFRQRSDKSSADTSAITARLDLVNRFLQLADEILSN